MRRRSRCRGPFTLSRQARDEFYKDVTADPAPTAAARGDVFITTSSLTKSYGLSSLRAGWDLDMPAGRR